MSEQQIKQIMKAMEDQNKVLESIQEQLTEAKETLKPIAKIYSDMSGFNRVALSVLKIFLIVGAAVGMLYGAIRYIRN